MSTEPDDVEILKGITLEMLCERKDAIEDLFTDDVTRKDLKCWQVDTEVSLEKFIGKGHAVALSRIPFPDGTDLLWEIRTNEYKDDVINFLEDLAIGVERRPERYFTENKTASPEGHTSGVESFGAQIAAVRSLVAERISKAKDILTGKFDESQVCLRIENWSRDTVSALSGMIKTSEVQPFAIRCPDEEFEGDRYETIDRLRWGIGWLEHLVERVSEHPELFFDYPESATGDVRQYGDVVYVMYGDRKEALELKSLLQGHKVNAKLLTDNPKGFPTLLQMMEESCNDLAFVFVILTEDERTKDREGKDEPRPRPNVLLELGYYLGRFGQDRVAVLCTKPMHEFRPSDVGGGFVKIFHESVTECADFVLNQLAIVGIGPLAE